MRSLILGLILVFLFSSLALAWEYEIKDVRRSRQTVKVEVEYVINGETQTIEVPVFAPKSKEDVLQGVENRGLTIKKELEDIQIIEDSVLPEIIKEKNKVKLIQ